MNTKKIFVPKNPAKYDHARRLYLDKVPMKEIASRIGVSTQTLSAWKRKGAWQERRNAEMLSPKTLYRKLLKQLDDLIEVGSPIDTADAISKICKQIKELQRDTTVDDVVRVLSAFGDWLINRGHSFDIDEEFVRLLTRYQDIYIRECIESDSLLNPED